MRHLRNYALLMLLAHVSASAAISDDRTPVSVRLVGDDGLTQKLRAGLKEAIEQSADLRSATGADQGLVLIDSEANVQPDMLGGRSVLIYAVSVHHEDGIRFPITGVCYEEAVSKCVSAILRVVRINARANVR